VWKSIILFVILCGCETYCILLTQSEGLWKGCGEDSIYRGRLEVTGDRGKLRNKELRDLYSLAYVIGAIESRGMRWARHVACVAEKR